MTSSVRAQDGLWVQPFDHEVLGPNATDYLAPFRSGSGFVAGFRFGGDQLPLPVPPSPLLPPGQPGGLYGWAAEELHSSRFNAIHMCLIPKGPHRGHVLVWNRHAVVLNPGTALEPQNRFWAFQAWSIVNPAPQAPQPRFRNFLLPMQAVVLPPGVTEPDATNPITVADLFCTGHAWSQHGDLVVAGGARFTYTFPFPGLAFIQAWQENGAKFLYMFDPARSSAPFPGAAAAFYSGEFGMWQTRASQGVELWEDRYYPTVTLTHRLNRTFQAETMIVSGGGPLPSLTPSVPGTDPLNSYESFTVRDSQNPNYLAVDQHAGARVFRGPGVTTIPSQDWLDFYARLHLLSDGKVFLSGPAWQGAKVNHENPPLVLNAWDTSVGRTGYAWPYPRVEGASVFFARYGGISDIVVRLCGDGGSPVGLTNTAEFCLATAAAPGPWYSLGNVPTPNDAGRLHVNAVILPDASILVIGGDNASGAVLATALYRQGVGWSRVASSPTPRRYHTCAVLLPDGRVFVGGGEFRHDTTLAPNPHDYDIYEPPYLHTSVPRPTAITLPGTTQTTDGTYLLANNQLDIDIGCDPGGLASFDKVVLIAPGSMTHHSDMSARYVEMASVAVTAARRTFSTPGETVLPRGYYMLFVLTNGGIPSEAVWVKIQ